MKQFFTYAFLFISLWLQSLHCKSYSNEEESPSEFSRNLEYHNQKREYHSQKREYHSLKSDYYNLKSDYQKLKVEFCDLKEELADLKKEIQNLKDNMYVENQLLKEENINFQDDYDEDQNEDNQKIALSQKRTFLQNFDDRLFYFELLPGYFYPTDKRLRDIYDNGGFNGQAEVGFFMMDWLSVWLKGGAFWKHGKTKVLLDSTRIIVGNLSAGIKFFIPIVSQVQFYLGAGPRVFFLRVKNDSSFVEQRVNKTQLGGAVIGGFLLFPVKDSSFFFDLFVDYSLSRMKFSPNQSSERNDIDLDGPTIGVGVGYQF